MGHPPVIKQWEKNNFTEDKAYINYPASIDKYVTETYRKLTVLQTELLNRVV
jgi:hypothetical protein